MSNNDKLGVSLREICGPLIDLFGKLASSNGQTWLCGLKKFLRGENPGDKQEEQFKTDIIRRVKKERTNISEEARRALIPTCYRRLAAFFETVAWQNTSLLLRESQGKIFLCSGKKYGEGYGLNADGVTHGETSRCPPTGNLCYRSRDVGLLEESKILVAASSWVHHHGDIDIVDYIKASVTKEWNVDNLDVPLVPICIPEQ